jgi:hypothetical protein
MFQKKPNSVKKEDKVARIIGGVFKEIFHSAGVVLGGALISAVLVSAEGRSLKRH